MAERTRRGKLQKAREGRVMASTPNYGFRFNAAKDGLVVCEPEMALVEKIFRMAAEGLGLRAMQTRLRAEGISSPKGGQTWVRRMLRRLMESDVYLPRTYEELSELASPEALTRFDPCRQYGIQWYIRQKARIETVSEPDGEGARRYTKRRTFVWKLREKSIAVPVPAYLDRDLVERARVMDAANRGSESKHLARDWELGGLVRCSCGLKMATQTTSAKVSRPYYYRCNRSKDYGTDACSRKAVPAQ